MLSLQRSAGNRAISALVGPASAPHAPGRALQRTSAPANLVPKHTAKLPDIPIVPKVVDTPWGEIKDLKVGGEFSAEPDGISGATAAKGGAVYGTEYGVAYEAYETAIKQHVLSGIDVKAKAVGNATTKELSIGAQVDFEGEFATSEVRIDLVKADPSKGEFDVLPVTYTCQFEKAVPPIFCQLGGQRYRILFKPSVSFTIAVKWIAVAESIGPAVLELLALYAPPMLALAVPAATAYELYYAKEKQALLTKMQWETQYSSLAMARGIFRDAGFGNATLQAPYEEGLRARAAMEAGSSPSAVSAVLAHGVRRQVGVLTQKIPIEALHQQSVRRAKDAWKAEHPIRVRLFGDAAVPGVFDLVEVPNALVEAEVRNYVVARANAAAGPDR